MKINHTILLVLFLSTFYVAKSQSYSIFEKKDSIILDGYKNEKTWQSAQYATKFIQNFPTDTNIANSKTEVQMCYDKKFIYIFATCFDDIDKKYVLQSLKRDFSYPRSDAFAVYLDTYNDKSNGFSFAVNPMGSQREGTLSNGGSFGVTTAWDGIWYSKVRRTQEAWFVEMKIPFNTIRFAKNNLVWGVNFSRNDLKRNENSSWQRVQLGQNIASMPFYGKLVWDKAPLSGLNIAAIPYLSTRIKSVDRKLELGAGIDGKIAISSSLNLDLTINPDFSQVEADVQQINLTRFNLFFPERRNFFIENQDLFSNAGFSQIRPFFSRKVGLYQGQIQPILFGAKLSGKIGSKNRIGLLNMQTTALKDNNDSTIKGAENVSNIVFQRQILGSSNVGLILVNRQGKQAEDFNRTGGIDFNYQHKSGKLKGKAFYHHSWENTKKKNPYAHASWLMYNNSKLFLMWNHEFVSKNYSADLGFIPRQNFYNPIKKEVIKLDYWRLEPEVSYTFYTSKFGLNSIKPGVYLSQYYNDKLIDYETFFQSYVYFQWKNSSDLKIYNSQMKETFIFPADVLRNGFNLPDSSYQYQLSGFKYNSNYRKPFSYSFAAKYGGFYIGKILNFTTEIKYRVQPWAQFSLNYNFNKIQFPTEFGGETELTLLGARSDISFTKNIYLTNFFQINSQNKNTSLNTRFQWRFRPLSDLYLVHTFNSFTNTNTQNHALVLKWVWWFNS